MAVLGSEALDWAIKHLTYQGDTDLFPIPFEIAAIYANWDTMLGELSNKEIAPKRKRQRVLERNKQIYVWSGGRQFLIPKSRYSYRIGTQLDPLDTLVLTAILYQYGSCIESRRIPVSANKVFSHRFKPSKEGLLYDPAVNWNQFWIESHRLAKSFSSGWVVMADVTDYYNQIYHHRLENELESAGVPADVNKSIIDLLMKLTGGVSRGIPIGPHCMHLLAEIAFDPIDETLSDFNYKYCRFIDDINIFCRDKLESEIALADLANILEKQQKLVLQKSKTKIVSIQDFLKISELRSQNNPRNQIERDMLKIIEAHSEGDNYHNFRLKTLSQDELDAFSEDNLTELFKEYLDNDEEPDYEHIRWLLRRLAQIGVPTALPYLTKRLIKLIPAIGELTAYINSAENNFNGDWNEIGIYISDALNHPVISHSEFLQITIINLFSKLSNIDDVKPFVEISRNCSPTVKRKIIKVYAKAQKAELLRMEKEGVDNTDPWLRRAIILGSSAFSNDERNHWLRQFIDGNNLLDKAVAKWVKSGGRI